MTPTKQNDMETPYGLKINLKQSSTNKNDIKTTSIKSKKTKYKGVLQKPEEPRLSFSQSKATSNSFKDLYTL